MKSKGKRKFKKIAIRTKSREGITKNTRKNFKSNGKFAKGNEIWQLANLGTNRSYETAEDLWAEAVKYFLWSDNSPLIEWKYVGASLREIPHRRPYTWDALTLYLGVSEAYIRMIKSAPRKDKDAFLTVIARIEKTIKNQKFEGAATGFFNANLISRDLGLADKHEHSGDLPITPPQINIVMGEGMPKFASNEKQVDSKEQLKKKKE